MKNLRAVLLAVCIPGAGLSACDAPALVAPDAPRFDGGPFVGSGNRAAAGDSTSSTTAATSSTETTAGSGN